MNKNKLIENSTLYTLEWHVCEKRGCIVKLKLGTFCLHHTYERIKNKKMS